MWADHEAGAYAPMSSIAVLSDDAIVLGSTEAMATSLISNIWYQSRTSDERALIVQRSLLLQKSIAVLMEKISTHNPNIDVVHISTGGSYAWKPLHTHVNDIDFNVIVCGSYFTYYDDFDIAPLMPFCTNQLKKVSFTIFGEDNLTRGIPVNDSITSHDYIQTNVTIREGIVMPYRNTIVCGRSVYPGKDDPEQNLLVRIDKQLFQSDLFLNAGLEKKYTAAERLQKALNRTVEAGILLNYYFIKDPYLVSYFKALEDVPLTTQHDVGIVLKKVRELRAMVGPARA